MKSTLIVINNFKLDIYLETIEKSKREVFEEVVVLHNSNVLPIKKNFYKIINIFKNNLIIRKILKEYNIIEIYCPNPYVLEFVKLCQYSKKKILFEEGISFFKGSENDNKVSLIKKLSRFNLSSFKKEHLFFRFL